MDLHLWALPTELQLVIANCQLDIATRMSHWPLKFSMSKTNPPFPAVPGCQLVLFPLLCPHLMKWCYHPPGCFHQKPWVILDSSFPPIYMFNPSASPVSFTPNVYLTLVPFLPWPRTPCGSSCHCLLPGLGKSFELASLLHLLPLNPHEWKWTLKSINQIRSLLCLNAVIWFPITLSIKTERLE